MHILWHKKGNIWNCKSRQHQSKTNTKTHITIKRKGDKKIKMKEVKGPIKERDQRNTPTFSHKALRKKLKTNKDKS